MLDELERDLGDRRVGRASCSELERHLPYVPLATALRSALASAALDAAHLPPLGQILPELMLAAPKREFDEVEVLEALVALVSEHAPLVLLLDDLQWSDPHTLAALGYLRRRGASLPVALVTTSAITAASPEHVRGRLKPDTVVRLEALSPDELAPLGMPELHESTGGNPRFVTEALANGRHGAPSRTLTEALLAQCRAEGDDAYRVLVAAAVLEQPFEPEPLADLLGADAAELTEELERLCEQRILRIDGFRFRFRYDLVRQVLLGSISPARQRLLHQRFTSIDEAAALQVSRLGSPAG
jgi:predicted ATPase